MKKATGKSIVDIGRLAGVSFATVARALRSDPHVAKETAQKVYKAAYRLGYVQKRKNAHPVIGIFMPFGDLSFYAYESFHSIANEIIKRGWFFEILPAKTKSRIKDQYLSGVINIFQGDDVAWNRNYTQPMITYAPQKPMLDNVYSIAEDGAHDVEKCVDYLWKLGHRRIGLLLNHSLEEDLDSMEQRYKAFLDSMQQRGSADPETNVFTNRDGALSSRIDRLLENGVTAVIVIAEALGLQVYRDLLRRGLKIPQDISLITWEIPIVYENLYPSITAMQQNYIDWAKTACDLFESIWAGKEVSRSILIPGHLIIRESCAPPIVRKNTILERKIKKRNRKS